MFRLLWRLLRLPLVIEQTARDQKRLKNSRAYRPEATGTHEHRNARPVCASTHSCHAGQPADPQVPHTSAQPPS